MNTLFEASVQKARSGPSTQLIEVTSCAERWNATIKDEEHSNFLDIKSYQSPKKLVKNLMVMTVNMC